MSLRVRARSVGRLRSAAPLKLDLGAWGHAPYTRRFRSLRIGAPLKPYLGVPGGLGAKTLRIGGIVDRDFPSDADAELLSDARGVYVQAVHEIENLFLHPPTLRIVPEQNGLGQTAPLDLLRDSAEQRAGSWIFQQAMAMHDAKASRRIAAAAAGFAGKQASMIADFAVREGDGAQIPEELTARRSFVHRER